MQIMVVFLVAAQTISCTVGMRCDTNTLQFRSSTAFGFMCQICSRFAPAVPVSHVSGGGITQLHVALPVSRLRLRNFCRCQDLLMNSVIIVLITLFPTTAFNSNVLLMADPGLWFHKSCIDHDLELLFCSPEYI